MKPLYNLVCENCESLMICEAFKDPRLYQAWKTLYRYKLSWNDVFNWRRSNVEWDKIDDSDITEYDKSNIDELFSIIRRAKRNHTETPFIVLGFYKEQLSLVYDANWGNIMATFDSYSNYWGSLDDRERWTVTWHPTTGKGSITQTEQFQRMRNCDYVLKVDISEKNAAKIRVEREERKEGSWELTADDHKSIHKLKGKLGQSAGGIDTRRVDMSSFSKSFYGKCKAMAAKAVARWKNIVAENKFKKDQDTTEIDNLVKDIMTRFPQACNNAMNDPEKYSLKNVKISVKDLIMTISDGGSFIYRNPSPDDFPKGAFLSLYQEYCEAVINLKNATSDGKNTNPYSNSYDRPSILLKKRDKYAHSIKLYYTKIDELLKRFDA